MALHANHIALFSLACLAGRRKTQVVLYLLDWPASALEVRGHPRLCSGNSRRPDVVFLQVAVIAPGETSAPYADKFYNALGISQPASFKPSDPPAEPPAPAQSQLWGIEYMCDGASAPSGWPLKKEGDEPTAVPASNIDAVRFK